jgi:hypothetical protein
MLDAEIDTIDLAQDVPIANSAENLLLRDVVGNKNDTVSGNSIIAWQKINKATIDIIETLVSSNDLTGTYAYTDAGGEQTIYEFVNTTRKIIYGIWLDLVNMTQNGTVKIYYKIDGSNYREVDSISFTVLTDSDGMYLDVNMGITNDFKITYTEGSNEGASRNIPYSIVYEVRE